MKALATFALLSLLTITGEAGEIHWNTFEGSLMHVWIDDGSVYGSEAQAYSVHDYSWSVFGSPEVIFKYTIDSYGDITRATPINMCNAAAPMAYWVWAQSGDVLTDLSDFKKHDLVYECHCDGIHNDVTGRGVSLPYYGTETYYLALLGGENFDEYWGWVELEGNQTDGLNVVSSAVSKDGPLIVGGGLVHPGPVPEPTSGLIMFLGVAGLALRRRRA